MGKKKIGLLALALVLALGALGVGYAAWEDSVTITGTVQTGSVDIEIIDYSNTYIWKVPANVSADEIYIQHTWDNPGSDRVSDPDPVTPVDAFPNPPYPPGSADVDAVAYADASEYVGGEDYDIQVDICNAFPLTALTADFLLHYNGTVPAKITVSDLDFTDDTNDPDADIADYVHITYHTSNLAGDDLGEITPAIGDQWHYCNYILVKIYVDLIQDDTLQLQSGTINGTITVRQWNEPVVP
jgi:hypothetical protein